MNYWPDLDTLGFNMLGNKSIACHYENTEEQIKKIKEYKNISEVVTLREDETVIIDILKVRKLAPDEVYKVSHLYDEPDNPSFMEKIKEKIENGIQDIYVLEDKKGIIGEVTIVYEDKHEGFTIKGQRVYMEALRIDKSMHNKGYDQFFVNQVDDIIKKQGYQEIIIGVEDDNFNAKHIYNKLGFTEFVSREPGDKYAPEGYDVWMKKLVPIIEKKGLNK